MSSSKFRYSSNLVIPLAAENEDNTLRQQLQLIFDALRTLATRIDETTGALSELETDWPQLAPALAFLGNNHFKIYAQADASISNGMMINLHNATTTTVKAKPAIANSSANVATGFYLGDALSSGDWGEFPCGPGINSGLSGLTPGTWYYLSPSSNGLITATKPTTAGQAVQLCGIAISDTQLLTGSFTNWSII